MKLKILLSLSILFYILAAQAKTLECKSTKNFSYDDFTIHFNDSLTAADMFKKYQEDEEPVYEYMSVEKRPAYLILTSFPDLNDPSHTFVKSHYEINRNNLHYKYIVQNKKKSRFKINDEFSTFGTCKIIKVTNKL